MTTETHTETHAGMRGSEHDASGPLGPGLLDEEVTPAAEPEAPKARRGGAVGPKLRRLALDRRVQIGVAALVLVAGGVGGYLWWLEARIEPPKTVAEDGFLETMEYAFLNDDFNSLPVEERLKILQDIIAKLRDMGQQDSLLMAMFASLIAGEAREQMLENVGRLAVDSVDTLAREYDPTASEEERRRFLLDAYVEIEETLESIAGIDREVTPEERIASRQRGAQREMEWAREGGIGASELARGFDLMNNQVGAYANGHQKRRIATMMRDMVKVMRRDTIGGEERVAGGE